jgi:formylglycine-generating enzyme required for sulfatase activity
MDGPAQLSVVGLGVAALALVTGNVSAAPDTMVRIEGGEYVIGSDDGPSDARPVHSVTLAPFLIERC